MYSWPILLVIVVVKCLSHCLIQGRKRTTYWLYQIPSGFLNFMSHNLYSATKPNYLHCLYIPIFHNYVLLHGLTSHFPFCGLENNYLFLKILCIFALGQESKSGGPLFLEIENVRQT